MTTRTRLAHLPFKRTLEEFGFGSQPSIDESQVKELANLAFVSEVTNILLLGPPGVGKTHLALALKSIANGYDTYFVWAYDRESATAFFSLVSARYERGSIILTSNKGFADWGELLGDTVIATAILDRLLHHSHVLNIRGESYRLKDKRQSGLLTSQHHLGAGPNNTKDSR